jgi:pimeloyl-ACP methyl ester carboxylesterase
LNNTTLWACWAPEAAFYLFFIWYARHIQQEAIHPPVRTRDQRLDLFNRVRAEIHDFESFLRGWFCGAKPEDVGLEELKKWINWAFWEGRANTAAEKGEDAEMDEYVDRIEQLVGKPFQNGPGTAKSLRLTLDPITIQPRTLFWYSLMMLADTAAIFLMKIKGFKYHRRTLAGLAAVFPPRPAALCTRRVSPAPKLSYFLRKHTSKTRLPVIFLHGIGIGMLPLIDFLDDMHSALNKGAAADDQVGILAVEILQISSRLTEPMPRRAEFVSQLTTLINHHFGHGRVVLVAHSYGTVLSSHVLRDPQLSPRISGTLLIDPVSILLHMPDVAYNFTVRPPVRANEWELWWFGSKDPQVAHTLGRHFFWSECILWRDEIENLIEKHNMRYGNPVTWLNATLTSNRFTASLSADDLVVNTRAVREYLTKGKIPDPVLVDDPPPPGRKYMELQTEHPETEPHSEQNQWRGSGLEVLWWNGHDHAGVFHAREDRLKLAKIIVEYCRGT